MTHFLIDDLTHALVHRLEASAWAGQDHMVDLIWVTVPDPRYSDRTWPRAPSLHFALICQLTTCKQTWWKKSLNTHFSLKSPLHPCHSLFWRVGHLGLFGVITPQRLPPLERFSSLEGLNMTSWRCTFTSLDPLCVILHRSFLRKSVITDFLATWGQQKQAVSTTLTCYHLVNMANLLTNTFLFTHPADT